MNITVIKLGGSLLGSQALAAWLLAIEAFAKQHQVIVVPGGGVFADCVREQQQKLAYSDPVAHRQALLSMCQTGYVFKEYCDALQIMEASGKLEPLFEQKLPLLWLPFELLEQTDRDMQTWDYTSDSLALWLSNQLHAESLILVKHEQTNNKQQLRSHINNGLIDKGFQLLIKETESKIYIFSANQHERLAHLDSWDDFQLHSTI